MAEQTWKQLFPISEDPTYHKAVEKIKRLERELAELQNEEIILRTSTKNNAKT